MSTAPHDALFCLVGAALHHGGAGTTGASLRAGLPTLTRPFFGDQPFWGHRVAALRVGRLPLDRRHLDVPTLAAASRAADEPALRRRARDLDERIAQGDEVAAAAEFLLRP